MHLNIAMFFPLMRNLHIIINIYLIKQLTLKKYFPTVRFVMGF
jgi:hypothetical protein